MTSPTRRTILALLAATLLAGCSSTGKMPLGTHGRSRSAAVIGDRPLAAAVGEPGARVASEADEPDMAAVPSSRARISGRVLDAQGRPVPDATVRLADGMTRGGRDLRTTTDRSGAFTLAGLRPGSTYTLIAETDDGDTRQRGSAEARSSETGVEINLAGRDGEASPRPDRPSRARPISNRSETSADGPLAEEAEAPPDPSARTRRPEAAHSGWRKVGSAPEPPSADAPREAEASGPVAESPDDGPNPLPPAIDRRTEAPTVPEPQDSGGLALAAEPPSLAKNEDLAPKLDPNPASAAATLPELPSLAANPGPSPIPTGPPDAGPPPGPTPATTDPTPHPAAEPVFASEGPTSPPSSAPADYNPFANPFVTQVAVEMLRPAGRKPSDATIGMDVKPNSAPQGRPAPAEPDPAPASAPEPAAAPARKMTWGEMAKVAPVPVAEPAVELASVPAAKGKARAMKGKKDESTALCQFDARQGKLVDFRLPDLEGKPVSLKDLDADLILLDFWGTWCKPCVDSVPHLVELQKKFGPGKLAVVGIACEEDDPKVRKAKVEAMSRKLGINYAVLLSGMDGPCPLREALHIQALPTMIVLDRSGKIRWRGEGATAATLDRLDRVVAASAAGRGDTVRR